MGWYHICHPLPDRASLYTRRTFQHLYENFLIQRKLNKSFHLLSRYCVPDFRFSKVNVIDSSKKQIFCMPLKWRPPLPDKNVHWMKSRWWFTISSLNERQHSVHIYHFRSLFSSQLYFFPIIVINHFTFHSRSKKLISLSDAYLACGSVRKRLQNITSSSEISAPVRFYFYFFEIVCLICRVGFPEPQLHNLSCS